jgi:alanine dehydrogenase
LRGCETIKKVLFCGTQLAFIEEEEVRRVLSLDAAIADVRTVLQALAQQQAVSCPRVRVEPQNLDATQRRRTAWLHTLRAGITRWGIAGGKDYTSIGFDTPAMWATVVDTSTGLPIALIEADYLSRVRTAVTAAVATDLLAPPDAACLAHFGAGKISELLVRAMVQVRPSIRRVLLVRHDPSKGTPQWLSELEGGALGELSDARSALLNADLVTTATSSRTPVIPPDAEMPRLRHINLVGSNHLKRREISDELARRCLPPSGYLVADDPQQAALEAGDFAALAESRALDWKKVPTLAQLLDDPGERQSAGQATLTAFKTVGIGLMDLALASGVLRRLGLLADVAQV